MQKHRITKNQKKTKSNILRALTVTVSLVVLTGAPSANVYADTTVGDADNYIISFDNDSAGYGNFYVNDENGGNDWSTQTDKAPGTTGVTTITSDAGSTIIQSVNPTDTTGSITTNKTTFNATGITTEKDLSVAGTITMGGATVATQTYVNSQGFATTSSMNSADATLQTNITNEASARITADSSLQTQIDNRVVIGSAATLGSLNNSNGGITNAGSITGVTNLTASGVISSNSLSTGTVNSTTISNSGNTGTGSLSVTNNATVGGTLGVTGNTSLSTVSTSGLATLNSASVTNGLTVGGSSTLNGATAINNTLTVNAGGGATELSVGTNSLTMAGTTNINNSVNSATNINTGTSTGAVTIGNAQNTVGMLGGTNTIGNAGSSVNTMTGASNTVTATGANSISAATTNTLTGGTGNSITATTGNNAITATTGSNTISANDDDQANTLSALGTNGTNNLTANATSGSNNIEAYNNRIGVATANSINTIGNTSAGTTVSATGGNSYMTVANGTASLRSGSGATASGLTTTSTGSTLSTDSATLSSELNGVGDNASRQNIAGAEYVNRLEGNTLINGNTYINGTLVYTSNTSANTTVTSGVSVLSDASQATNGQVSISNIGGTGATVDANGKISTGIVGQSTASVTLTNGLGNTHGLIVTESQATMSGGTHSSSLTLADNGATFSNAQTGRPIQVHGVDDGTADYDAVNVRQLASGVAMAAGLAALPQVEPGKRFGVAAGTGIYMDKISVAVGLSARFLDSLVVKGGISMVPSYGQFNQVGNIGIGYSW